MAQLTISNLGQDGMTTDQAIAMAQEKGMNWTRVQNGMEVPHDMPLRNGDIATAQGGGFAPAMIRVGPASPFGDIADYAEYNSGMTLADWQTANKDW